MEYILGNIEGDFEPVNTTCPRCNSMQVMVATDSKGYFYVVECHKCGYRNQNIMVNMSV